MGPPIQHRGVVWSVQFSSDGRSILTASEDGTARLQPVPSQLEGGVEQISLWARVLTGMELARTRVFASWIFHLGRNIRIGSPNWVAGRIADNNHTTAKTGAHLLASWLQAARLPMHKNLLGLDYPRVDCDLIQAADEKAVQVAGA